MITDYTRLINKEYPLPPDYVPPDLIDIGLPFDCAPGNPKRLLEKDCICCQRTDLSQSARRNQSVLYLRLPLL